MSSGTALLEVRMTGLGHVRRQLAGLARDVTDLSPVYRRIAADLRERIWPSWWASEGGGSWAYRREERRYVAFKRRIFGLRRGQTPPVLRWIARQNRKPEAGERLYPSFVDARDPGHVEEVTPRSLSVGSSLDYALAHHEGRGRGPDWAGGYPLPQRRLVDLQSGDLRTWDRIAQRWLDDIGALRGRAGVA